MARREGTGRGPQSASITVAMLLMRLFLGGELLRSGITKWSWLGTETLHTTLTAWTTGDTPAAYPTYLSFLTTYILPHAPMYTYLVVFGEIIVGAMLILGLATRLAALPALLMSINFLLATWNKGYEWQLINESFIVLELGVLIAGAGRYCGIDSTLAKKHPSLPLW